MKGQASRSGKLTIVCEKGKFLWILGRPKERAYFIFENIVEFRFLRTSHPTFEIHIEWLRETEQYFHLIMESKAFIFDNTVFIRHVSRWFCKKSMCNLMY